MKRACGVSRNTFFGPQGMQPAVWVLCGTVVVALTSSSIFSPILPILKGYFGVGNSALGLFVSSFGFARLMMDVPAGILADRFSLRLLTAAGLFVIFAGNLAGGFSATFPGILVARAFAGLGSSLVIAAVLTWLNRLSEAGNRATLMSLYQFSRRIGTSAYPVIGGWLAAIVDWRAVFFFCGALAVAGLASSVSLLKDPGRPTEAGPAGDGAAGGWRAEIAALWPGYLAAFELFLLREGIERNVAPILGSGVGMTSVQLGAALSLAAVISLGAILIGGVLADRFGIISMMILGQVVTTLGLALFLTVKSVPGYYAASIILGIAAFSTGLPPSMAGAYGGANVGRMLGTIRLMNDLGMVLGPALFGSLAEYFDLKVTVEAAVGISAVSALVLAVPLVLRRRKRERVLRV